MDEREQPTDEVVNVASRLLSSRRLGVKQQGWRASNQGESAGSKEPVVGEGGEKLEATPTS